MADATSHGQRNQAELDVESSIRAALEATADGLLVVSIEGKMVTHNARFLELWRVPPEIMARGNNEEALAFVRDQVVDPDAFTHRVRQMHRSTAGESFDVLRLRDGRVLERYSWPWIVGGHHAGRALSFRDVTEWVRAEESRFRSVMESVRDAVVTTDGQGLIVGWNHGARDTFGYADAEVIGQPLSLLIPERHRPTYDQGFGRVRDSLPNARGGSMVELVARRKDGTEFPCEFTINAWTAAGAVNFSAFIRDITERRRSEAALLLQSRVLESMKELVVVIDGQGTIVFANRALEKGFGYDPGELLGRPVQTLEALPPEESSRRVQGIFAELAARGRWVGECPNRRKDGTLFTCEVSITSLTIEDRTLYVSVQEDVTERRAMQSKLLLSDRMASVGTLAAGVAHEVNNPLAYVTANIDLAAEEVQRVAALLPAEVGADLTELLGTAREGAERVRRIVRELKTFSRADEEHVVALAITPVLDWSARVVSNEIRHRARLVKVYGETPLVRADEARLGQVFVNLLVNAAHAIPEGHADANEIRVVTGSRDGQAFIEIQDTGAGIPAAQLGRIFDPFFTTKPIGQGTGLGLSICHRIVTDLGGEISVQSEVGRGTVFRVILPAGRADPSKAPRALSVHPGGPVRGRVLVIDDDATVAASIKRVLREHDTRVVQGAREALALLASGDDFDVVLCDLMMPEVTGMEFHESLRATAPAMAERVVFVTGGAFTPAARTFLDGIDNEVVEKPFEARALRSLVQRLVRGRPR